MSVEVVAFRGRLLPGAGDAYEQAHAEIPGELLAAQRRSGIRSWRIFSDGLDLFHVAEWENFEDAMHRLAEEPADQHWQREMAKYKQPIDESGATERRLRLIYARDLLR